MAKICFKAMLKQSAVLMLLPISRSALLTCAAPNLDSAAQRPNSASGKTQAVLIMALAQLNTVVAVT